MLRKRRKKRDVVRIGIFEGKSGPYNKAILEVIREQGPLTAWGIAKKIQRRRKPTTNKEAAQNKAHKIYSVIQRKDGRLSELQKKHYIVPESGKWSLTIKGRIALYINNPQLLEALEVETYKQGLTLMRKESKTPSDVKAPFGISINGKEFMKDYRKVLTRLENDPSYFRLIIEETKQLIMEGIDLDFITIESLVGLLGLRKTIKKTLRKLL